ncbi:biotin--[acetyl-CoA-carboxylase] ligase [Mannheimia granulomatis]|uniref:biotin--[biotin carboxyl-carrier protein] ligase n=1 Tax=Mannheimia granulomatis TaxID=85402 RepID=A0A6G8JJF5_9PAST|nr:biotin--[acetyl-CoA-carboxylase] ligase [Mannheimia granulomatis]QIM67320.1 biotin--[acetyl-CoA-carboxylase] ligase [Mannheimia granulomatis]
MKLNQAQIQSALICGQAIVFDEIDSTNEYLLKHHQVLENGSICLAEKQSAGRGRRGRSWYSPESENLYFSILWHYPTEDTANLPPLSLVVALIIAESLQAQEVEDIQIKWPNDIYYKGKKMGGILLETKANRLGLDLVIGIGLNLGMTQVDKNVVTQAWADLSQYHFERNQLVCHLAHELQKNLKIYPLVGFSHYVERWQAFDIFHNKAVKLITEADEIHGISLGINEQGELMLKQGDIVQNFGIGEISLRAE